MCRRNRYHREVHEIAAPAMPDVTPIADDDETFIVTSRVVGCDGGGGALGHPLVYLRIEHDGDVVCPYCSRRFVLADGGRGAHNH
jgi:uncharacterized Zn-finger protein